MNVPRILEVVSVIVQLALSRVAVLSIYGNKHICIGPSPPLIAGVRRHRIVALCGEWGEKNKICLCFARSNSSSTPSNPALGCILHSKNVGGRGVLCITIINSVEVDFKDDKGEHKNSTKQ